MGSLNKMQIYDSLHLLTLFIILNVNISSGNPASQIMNKAQPLFISQSEAFKFAVGDVITLPCEVTQPGSYVLAWKKGIAILTAGTVKVTPDSRVKLVNGYTLQISDAVEQDAGDYICQIATMEPREITHHVEILVPPKIHRVTSGGQMQVKKGSPVRLECITTGNPTPNITWTRKNNLLPTGDEKLVAPVYLIDSMDRHKGGTYICTANNGVGQVTSSQINLHVLYPPEITVENPVVYSGEGQEALLACVVHGETQPEVQWYKDTMQIDQTERHVIENRGARNTLIIRRVHLLDFGNYSCVAENQLGKSKQSVYLTGKPKAGSFRSAPISQWKDKYNISWIVDSHSTIEEYKLYYRLITADEEQQHNHNHHHMFHDGKNDLSQQQPHQQQYNPQYTSQESELQQIPYESYGYQNGNGNGYGNLNNWPKTEWRDILLPAYPYSHHYTQGMSYMLRGLDPDSQYEVKIQSRNRFGWSDFSDSFTFATSNQDTEMRDLSVTHYIASSGDIIFHSHYFVKIISIVVLFKILSV